MKIPGNETYTMASPAVLSPLPTTAATWFKASDPETEVENVRAGDADGYHGGENGLAHVLEGLMQVEKDELQSGIDRGILFLGVDILKMCGSLLSTNFPVFRYIVKRFTLASIVWK